MSIQKEIWSNEIHTKLFPDNSFMTKGTNMSHLADYHKIHIPIDTTTIGVEQDRATFPAEVKRQTFDTEYIEMHHYSTDPQHILNPETVELSFIERNVITTNMAESLNKAIADQMLNALVKNVSNKTLEPSSVIVSIDMLAQYFDKADYPDEGRYALLTAEKYHQLLAELTDGQSNAFLNVANVSTGVLGKLFGINILKRSSLFTQGEFSRVGLIGWHQRDLYYAVSPVEVFHSQGLAPYYGDVISSAVRAGAYCKNAYIDINIPSN